MSPFLQVVAQNLVDRFGQKISEVTLVFPSRRASLFFNTHLAKLIERPIWAPTYVTINELMQSISGLKVDDPINLITKLYAIYNKIRESNEPFENFYFWGEVMLADFDQVDKYLVDPKLLFGNIKDLKDIEDRFGELLPEQTEALRDYLGVINENQPSALRENYLSVWEILLDIYIQFKAELEIEGIAYEGMSYSRTAEILSNPNSTPNLPNPIAFIGFNALNECEKALLHHCKREGSSLFYWDYDTIFTDNPNHEAGLFIRQNLLLFPNSINRDFFPENQPELKIIKMVTAPSTVAQTKLVPRILDEMQKDGAKLDVSTAIVFPKENILIPTLQAIPNIVDSLNITMGYPIRETPAYSIAELLVRLQINAQSSSEGIIRFYHRDVLAVLNHPYIRLCETENSAKIVSEIKRRNKIYPKADELTKSSLLNKIFVLCEENKPLTSYLLEICGFLAQNIAAKSNDSEYKQLRIDLEFLYSLHKSLTRLGGVLANLTINLSHKVYIQLLRKAFAQERVSFNGEPLEGLQIMGFLETRALDFENLIILSFNDDILPGRNQPVSFITPSLRVAFGLPDYKHHDAVYAYYFYRLLKRTKRVYLVYNGRSEGLSSGEKSRFALQLEMEQMIGQILTIPVGYNLSLTPSRPISIKKSPQVIEGLLKNLSKRSKGVTLSPSGLTTYMNCPLRFYFRYVVGIDEGDEVAEEIGALEFGRIIHNTMEELYKEHTGNIITADIVKSILVKSNNVEETLDRVFCEIFLNDTLAKAEGLSGRNLLARNAMLYTIKKMLRFDADRVPFQIVSHEQEVYVAVSVSNSEIISNLMLGGYVDRVELNNGTIWSIDYKTGKHKNKGKFESIQELFDPSKVEKCKEVFQTFCYSLALSQIYPNTPIKPALWFVKAAKGISDLNINISKNRKTDQIDDFRIYQDEFKAGLGTLLSEIFDTTIEFTQTSDNDKCKICPYVGICGRD